MKILFLDHTGKLGGAELCLADIAKQYSNSCLVALFEDGPFRKLLEEQQIPVEVVANEKIEITKDSGFIEGIKGFLKLFPLILDLTAKAKEFDLIYANTQKSLVVGSVVSRLSGRPLVHHLHDILSSEHFSQANRKVVVTLENFQSSLVIANSHASKKSFIASGGKSNIVEVAYNGFKPELYYQENKDFTPIRQELELEDKFIIGHFSRLSEWKGQDVLLKALAKCPDSVVAILVGDALFGEDEYVNHLHELIDKLGLKDRVKFLGFRNDPIPLMNACDLIVHTSTAPEPLGRVIIEAMLCQKPVIAADAGGATELVDSGKTGWLTTPGDAEELAQAIITCVEQPEYAVKVADRGRVEASKLFNLDRINQQIKHLLENVISK